jgi:citrate lyase subunit beta/citryl-CoA lyase
MAEAPDVRGWRTLLFVPADRPDMLAKAASRGADAIVVDLEDAIAPSAKAAARAALATHLREGVLADAAAVCVRVNAIGEGAEDDLAALAGCDLDAVMLPKVARCEVVEQARRAIDAGFEDSESIGLVPQIESVRGILGLESLARTAGVSAVAFGGEDFCVDLGVARSEESLELLVPRALLGLHAHDAGLPAIDTVYTAIDDEVGLVREATIARQLGLSGKLLIHPAQVAPVRRVFTPSEEELAWARRVLATQSNGGGEDVGVHVVDGKMVDAPVIAQAERIVARGD